MHDDDPAQAEAVIQRRLAQVGGCKSGRAPFGQRHPVLMFVITTSLVLVLSLAGVIAIAAWPTQGAARSRLNMKSEEQRRYEQETPLIIGSIVPAMISSLVTAVAAFILVRGLGEHARYGAVATATLCGVSAIVALMVWISGGGGFSKIATANAGDVFAVFAVPIGFAAVVGALAGWKVAELE